MQIRKARLELIPITDMVFLLLTFFMFAIVQMQVQQGLKVDLPQVARAGRKANNSNQIAITITKKNEIYFNKEAVSLNELYRRVASEKQKGQAVAVVVNGDERSNYGTVVRVLDVLDKAGVKQLFFEIEEGKSYAN